MDDVVAKINIALKRIIRCYADPWGSRERWVVDLTYHEFKFAFEIKFSDFVPNKFILFNFNDQILS